MKKRILTTVLIISIIFICNTFADDCIISFRAGSTVAKICDKGYKLDTAPVAEGNTVLLPFRFIADRLGLDITWNDQTRTAVADGQGYKISIATKKNSNDATVVYSDSKTLDGSIKARYVIRNSRLLVDHSTFAKILGLSFTVSGKDVNSPVDPDRIRYRWIDFTLPVDSEDGKTITLSNVLSDSSTKALLVEFWYTACTHCKTQLAHLETLYKKYQNKGLVVLSISTDGPGNEGSRRELLEEIGVTFPTLLDEKAETYNAWMSPGFPNFQLVVPGNKFVVMRNESYSEEANAKLEQMVQELCSGN
ncbi:MAG: redoxin domain-containing protein [Caldisericales bacterium]|nr:redoxin domain-containing protein [Caldisericales bacterium]